MKTQSQFFFLRNFVQKMCQSGFLNLNRSFKLCGCWTLEILVERLAVQTDLGNGFEVNSLSVFAMCDDEVKMHEWEVNFVIRFSAHSDYWGELTRCRFQRLIILHDYHPTTFCRCFFALFGLRDKR